MIGITSLYLQAPAICLKVVDHLRTCWLGSFQPTLLDFLEPLELFYSILGICAGPDRPNPEIRSRPNGTLRSDFRLKGIRSDFRLKGNVPIKLSGP